MAFTSIEFIIFIFFVFIIYWAVPARFRMYILLAAGYFFYARADIRYPLILILVTVVSYFSASVVKSRRTFIVSAILTVSPLFILKYLNFFVSVADPGIVFNLILPLGISFYTLQALSYVADVYWRKLSAEKNFLRYAVYLSFFPCLTAGPIERASDLLPQICDCRKFDPDMALSGIRYMILGYFKKAVIADTLAIGVNVVFDNVTAYKGMIIVLAVLMYTMQIYFDFSGYSDIAVGVAKLLGINLITNFRQPYLSKSIKEFWRRWHISLSSWLKDYIYIPLGGNRKGEIRKYVNIMITFLISGLWHGAAWNYVIWGGIHGAGQVAENLFGKVPIGKKVPAFIRWAFTFAFVSLAWVFFRNDINASFYIFRHMFDGIADPVNYVLALRTEFAMTIPVLILVLCEIAAAIVIDLKMEKNNVIEVSWKSSTILRYMADACIIVFILIMCVKTQGTQFIYAQF